LLAEVARQLDDLDQFLDIGEVLETIGGSEPRHQFQLDQLRQRDDAVALAFDRHFPRLGKSHRLRLAVAGIFAARDEIDSYARLGIAKLFPRARKRRNIASPHEPSVNGVESLGRSQQIDVLGKASEAVS